MATGQKEIIRLLKKSERQPSRQQTHGACTEFPQKHRRREIDKLLLLIFVFQFARFAQTIRDSQVLNVVGVNDYPLKCCCLFISNGNQKADLLCMNHNEINSSMELSATVQRFIYPMQKWRFNNKNAILRMLFWIIMIRTQRNCSLIPFNYCYLNRSSANVITNNNCYCTSSLLFAI